MRKLSASLIYLPLLLLLPLLLVTGCSTMGLDDFDEPEVELVGLEPLPSQGMEARFLVRLRIVNPNSTALDIDGMAYEVYLRDSRILSGVSNQALAIPAFSEETAELEVAAGMLASLALLRDFMTNPPDAGIPYTLKAKLSRGGLGGTIRVSREGVIDLGQKTRTET